MQTCGGGSVDHRHFFAFFLPFPKTPKPQNPCFFILKNAYEFQKDCIVALIAISQAKMIFN
jgi:hypothetical protein